MASPDVVLKKVNALPQSLAKAHANALKAAGDKARSVMQSAPGAPHVVAHRAQKVTARMIGNDTVSVKWTAGARLVDSPTQPHFIARRGGGSLRRQNLSSGPGARRRSARAGRLLLSQLGGGSSGEESRRPIGIPGIGPRQFARHPGTKGKHFVAIGKTLARPQAAKVYAQKQLTEPMQQVFRG